MLSGFQSAVLVCLSIAAAISFLLVIRRYWTRRRPHHNDIIGWQIGFLGTTYAVIIAFVLSDVWGNYQAAETNAELEANSLVNMYRVAAGLSSEQRKSIQSLAQSYAEVMVHSEWPAMASGGLSVKAHEVITEMWTAVVTTQPGSPNNQISLQRELNDLSNLTEHRRVRILQSRSKLPGIFWVVLISGGTLTVVFTCLFDIEEIHMHLLQVIGVTFMIALVLTTIADLDSPFAGAIRISSTCFDLALRSMGVEPWLTK